MLDSSAFTFKHYIDNRVLTREGFTVGRSGPLLTGIYKPTGKKYLIKHTYPHNAANEYVACWLAEKLGIPAPKAYLLTPNKAFSSPYAVAIEFIEGLGPFPKDAVPESMIDDLIGQFTLCLLLHMDDMIQLSKTENHIYSYDFSESFLITNLRHILLSKNDDEAIELLKPTLNMYHRFVMKNDFDVPGLAREFHLDPQYMSKRMKQIVKRSVAITKDEIEQMSDELIEMYSIPIGVYYEECIESIKERAENLTVET